MKEQQNIYTLTKSQVSELSSRHIRGVDKWYRMCAGLASNLERYENGIIYLKINNTEKKLPSNYKTAVQIAGNWLHNEELKSAKGFVVFFYKTKFTGFMAGLGTMNKDALEDLCQQFKDVKEEEPDLINIFAGLFS